MCLGDDVDKIITCSGCQGHLLTADVYCPHCGVQNTWEHPELKTLLHYIHSGLDVPDKYHIQMDGPLLMVTAVCRSRFQCARCVLLLFLLGWIVRIAGTWGQQHFALFVVLLLSCFCGLVFSVTSRPCEKWLLLDYLQDQPVWRSNDEKYFTKVLARLNLPSAPDAKKPDR